MDELQNINIKKSSKQKKLRKDIIKICNQTMDVEFGKELFGKNIHNIEKNEKVKFLKTLKEYFIITIGTIFMAIGISLFLVPNELSTGGFSGISVIIYYLFKFPIGITMLILNIPLLILAYFKISKELFYRSIYGTVVLSVFIDIMDKVQELTHDKFLSCIYGGILVGIGIAVILKENGSTGGSDLLSYIIREYKPQYRSSNLILIIDIIIVTVNVIFFRTIEVGLYSAIAIYLMGKMIDIIFEGTNFAKVLLIVSPQYNEIAKAISKHINRGSTGLYSKGMYTNEEKMTLLCVGSRTESYIIQNIAKKVDIEAFVIILNAREVLGKGFK